MAAGDRDTPTTSPAYVEERLERRRRTRPNKRMASEQRVKQIVKAPPINPDGWGVRINLEGDESHAFVFDYKVAHKISAELVKYTVAKEKLFIEVTQRMHSNKAKSDSMVREHEKTEEAIAMALTQVFDYMVRNEVAYGYMAAGAFLLLLHIDRSDLYTLYCHACVLEEDIGGSIDGGLPDNKLMNTVVA